MQLRYFSLFSFRYSPFLNLLIEFLNNSHFTLSFNQQEWRILVGHSHILHTKPFNIVFDCLVNYLKRGFAVAHLVYCCFFVFKIFIHSKEMSHFIKNMLWKLANIFIHVIIRVAERNSDYLFVVSSVIYHRNNTYGICSDKGHRLNLLRAKQKHIERVIIITQGARNKAVVAGSKIFGLISLIIER